MSLEPETASVAPTGASPIADLSYRNYDGPLQTRTLRWWVVSLYTLRTVPRMKFFWSCALLAVLPYFIVGITLYTRSLTKGFGGGPPGMPFGSTNEPFAVSFFQGMRMQSFFLFLLALLVGAGSIAADTRANALQVYLSKPITKGDYLLGKWFGVFLPVYLVALIPALALYVFCLFSFTDDGFLKQDPWLLLRIFAVAGVPSAIHASLLLGFSGWSKTPFMAGAAYAGFFFASQIIAGMVWIFRFGIPHHGDPTRGVLVRSLSLGGVIQGLAQNIYHVTINRVIFRDGGPQRIEIPPPSFWVVFWVALALIAIGAIAARQKVRAVEVIRG
jgi:ABC-2 type transport system permease protein